jgi:hypothetical protein
MVVIIFYKHAAPMVEKARKRCVYTLGLWETGKAAMKMPGNQCCIKKASVSYNNLPFGKYGGIELGILFK